MSGGLDSSVAAGLLLEQGFDVIGITIKTYKYEDVGGNISNDTSCCSIDGINDARRVATKLGIPHYVYDFTEVFSNEIIDYFTNAYLSGETPNPCVMCNKKIKWAELIKRADALGADFIATGHYAKIEHNVENDRYYISKGNDLNKDQSYALWAVSQENLSRTLFPLSGFDKTNIRELAKKYKLPIADKSESYEICFIPDNNYERFLKDRVEGLEEKVSGGDIVRDGNVIGKHRGFPFYTIGQRKGLAVSQPEPVYVIGIYPETNTVEVGTDDQLLSKGLIADNVNMMKFHNLIEPKHLTVKIRYKDEGHNAICRELQNENIEVIFDNPRKSVTKGQSIVIYDGCDVVGGGVIKEPIVL